MQRAEKVIISTAVTGSVNVPSQSDYLPLSAEQVVQASLEAAAAGSAIIHLHARHPDGRPAFEASIFEEIIPAILSEVDVVINTPSGRSARVDGYEIRAAAVAADLPLFTTIAQLGAAVASFEAIRDGFDVRSLQEYAIDRAQRLAAQ